MLGLFKFGKGSQGSLSTAARRSFSQAKSLNPNYSKFLIVGAGNAGVTVASTLLSLTKSTPYDIRVVEPNTTVVYEPGIDLVAARLKTPEEIQASIFSTLNDKIKIHHGLVTEFKPESNSVVAGDRVYEYDYLILATGVVPAFDKIKGLEDALSDPESGVVSTYNLDYAVKARTAFEQFIKGNVIFYNSAFEARNFQSAINLALLFEADLRETRGKSTRDISNLEYVSPFGTFLPLANNSVELRKLFENRDINTDFGLTLTGVDKKKKTASFNDVKTNKKVNKKYDLLYVAPPVKLDPKISNSKALADNDGLLDIDPRTLAHNKYKNVFAVGHCTRVPEIFSQKALLQQCLTVSGNVSFREKGVQDKQVSYNKESELVIFTGNNQCLKIELVDPRLESVNEPSTTEYYSQVHLDHHKFFKLQTRGRWFGSTWFRKPTFDV